MNRTLSQPGLVPGSSGSDIVKSTPVASSVIAGVFRTSNGPGVPLAIAHSLAIVPLRFQAGTVQFLQTLEVLDSQHCQAE